MYVKIIKHVTLQKSWQQWHINRPERFNGLGTSIAQELNLALEGCRKELSNGLRAIVITAEPILKANSESKIWVAGGDLKELAQLKNPPEGRAYAALMRKFCEGLEFLPIPVVSVIDGNAIGGGAELALAADIRFATSDSQLEFKQLNIGLATGYGSAQKLVSLVGKSRAQALLYFCERISASDAVVQGLIHRVIPNASHLEIENVLGPILSLEPKAFAAQKQMFQRASHHPTSNNTWADDLFESIWMNDTHKQSLSSFSR